MLEIFEKFAIELPVTNPVLIFSLVLFVILFAPLILNRFKIPHIIGLILAGVALGEKGFGILSRDESFELFGSVGLLYIMFLAGLQMDLSDFKKMFKQFVKNKFDNISKESDLKVVLSLLPDETEDDD